MNRAERLSGVLLGTAVGDALGLPREGLHPVRAQKLFGKELRHAFIFGTGMVSDDTEHACMCALAMLEAEDAPECFGHSLAKRLRLWLACGPAERIVSLVLMQGGLGYPLPLRWLCSTRRVNALRPFVQDPKNPNRVIAYEELAGNYYDSVYLDRTSEAEFERLLVSLREKQAAIA